MPHTWSASCIIKLYPHRDHFSDVLVHNSSTLRLETERSSKNSVRTYNAVLRQGTDDGYPKSFVSYTYINIE
jgi:hypothetical protein